MDESLLVNPLFVPLLGIVITILVAVFVSRHYYLASRRERVPYYALKTSNLVSDLSSKIPNFKALFNEQQIKNLTVSKIAIWNAGRETIRNEDMPQPLHIVTMNETKILSSSFIKEPSALNAVTTTVEPTGKWASLNFKFLDRNEGALLRVIFDGKSESDLAIEFRVMGGEPLRRWNEHSELSDKANMIQLGSLFLGLIPLALITYLTPNGGITGVLGLITLAGLLAVFGLCGLGGKRLARYYDSNYSQGAELPSSLKGFLDPDW